MSSRVASHAGSWYSSDQTELTGQLTNWLHIASAEAEQAHNQRAFAVIAPHAGYTFCGPTLAAGYNCIPAEQIPIIKTVILMGPSHTAYLDSVATTSFDFYETPLGPIEIDQDLVRKLVDTGRVEVMSTDTDIAEHSFEMHTPFIKHILPDAKLVPLMVGSLDFEDEQEFGKFLSNHFACEDGILWAVSTDFCHWGKNFSYRYIPPEASSLPIHEGIKLLDTEAMTILSDTNPSNALTNFKDYLDKTQNTICGRHSLSVLMSIIETNCKSFDSYSGVKWVDYKQSNVVRKATDMSVSYASGAVMVNI